MSGFFWGAMMAREFSRMSTDGGASARATSAAGRARQEVRWLEERVDKLAMVCKAMWELLEENTNLTEADLMTKIEQIDLADGKADGKIEKGVTQCTRCGRTLSRTHSTCMYCGAERSDRDVFDGT